MATEITWEPIWLDGSRDCWFSYGKERVRMHACDVIAKSWKDDTARDLWAQTEAAKIIARLDYEASDAGKLAVAKAEHARLADAVAVKAAEVATLQAKAGK
jgi:hypothetical protein